MADEGFTAQQAASGLTPGSVLAQIAAERPDLRPYLAVNPAAYPELLQWLARLGDPEVDAALAYRAAQARAAVKPPVPPVAMGGLAQPHEPGMLAFVAGEDTVVGPLDPGPQVQAPTAGRGPEAAVEAGPRRRGLRLGWVLAGLTLVVVVALVVGFLFWPRSGSSATLVPYPTKPHKTWTFQAKDLSWSDEARNSADNSVIIDQAFQVGPVWIATATSSGDGGQAVEREQRVAGVDPLTGTVLWQRLIATAAACRGNSSHSSVFCLEDGGPGSGSALVVLDAVSGEERARTDLGFTVELGWFQFAVVGEDVVVMGPGEDGVQRISRFDKDGTSLWTLSAPLDLGRFGGHFYAAPINENLLIGDLNGGALWLLDENGDVAWRGSGWPAGIDTAGRIFVSSWTGELADADWNSVRLIAVTAAGQVEWERDGYWLPLRALALAEWDTQWPFEIFTGHVFALTSDRVLVELDPKDGSEKRMFFAGRGDLRQSASVVTVSDQLVVNNQDELLVGDLTTGGRVWSRAVDRLVDENASSFGRMWADGERLVLQLVSAEEPESDSGRVIAVSLADGSRVWEFGASNQSTVREVGGQLVLVDDSDGSLSLLRS